MLRHCRTLKQDMGTALPVHRFQFAFTLTFHYIFPQLTMRLALLVVLKTMAWRTGDEHYNRCARFWIKIFGINFAMGVVPGIPALNDTISQAAPTLCMNVPTSETTSAMSKLRKVDDRRGRHRLVDP